MTVPKKYLHDRLILLLLSVDSFFTILLGVLILLRLNADKSTTYIISYRAGKGLNPFEHGNSLGLLAFIAFAVFQLAFNIILSIKVYHVRRYFSVAILAMTLLLAIIALIVSNALLILR